MEDGTRAIVELAWARELGLLDDAFTFAEPGERLTRTRTELAMFVSLWEHRVLVGPGWLLERAADVDDLTLGSGPGLLRLAGEGPEGPGSARLLGEAVLAFTDAYADHPGLDAAVVADEEGLLADLQRECPPDDVTEVGLAGMEQRFVLLDDREAPVAGAGYAERQGILAHLGVLTPPALRHEGHGTLVGALALNDALDAGLVAEWRCRETNLASLALGRRLGFEPVGRQTTVLLAPA
ncbi:GNAT family N-acetyltransferase [Microlunatus flavus]|uniref:GNAT acetyltransferase n=1 Tax=Microlunatus flavus TaxID=1036181 RepID=A0A1H9LR70_9ACTN|nr:GNAT family N-acetyltransferase [Microlunatus flavus]SER13916.1 GNAT acetyltransferase [Microlunatus flavus]